MLEAYDDFEFHLVYHQLVQYCAADLSSFYLDVLKDRLYCDGADGAAAALGADRAATAWRATCALLLAPVLPFTADEVWPPSPAVAQASVHLALFPEPRPADDALLERWAALLEVRAEVTKALEEARAAEAASRPAWRRRSWCAARPRRWSRCARTTRGAASSRATWPTSSS